MKDVDIKALGEIHQDILSDILCSRLVNKWRFYKLFRSRDMGRAVAVRRWTTTAVECYKRGCNCEGCFYKDFFSGSSQKCQMKASVLELVRVIGTPDVELPQFLAEEV